MTASLNIDPVTGIVDAGHGSIGASILWLEKRLQALNVQAKKSARLSEVIIKLKLLRANAEADGTIRFPSAEEGQRWYIDAMGVDFLAKALHQGEQAGLSGFDKHYSYLIEADPILTGAADDSQTARNKTWELLLASLVATFAKDVTPDEPDVVCTVGGRRLGLAAKVLYSNEINKHLHRLSEGAQQIEKAQVDDGLVVVNLVEQFPHAQMLRNVMQGAFKTNQDVVDLMDVWFDCYMKEHDMDAWRRRLKDKQKFLGVLFFVPTALPLVGLENPLAGYFHFHGRVVPGKEEQVRAFLGPLNTTAYSTLSFRTPSA